MVTTATAWRERVGILILALILGSVGVFVTRPTILKSISSTKPITMKLSSPAFKDNAFIPDVYTCDGENISPPFIISDVPRLTESLTLIINDPDAPGGDWAHWLVWNLSPKTSTIPAKWLPTGAIQGLNDFGETSFGGPCPPSGTHRYRFTLYALDTKLDLSPLTKKADLLSVMRGHVIEQAVLTGLYHRR